MAVLAIQFRILKCRTQARKQAEVIYTSDGTYDRISAAAVAELLSLTDGH